MRANAPHRNKTVPVLGRAQAVFHLAGVDIIDSGNALLSQIASSERIINIDNKLMSAVLIDDLDEAMSQFDVRGPYAVELGRALAVRVDQLAIITLILAARASSTISGLFGGSVVADADMKVSGVALANALFACAQVLDEKNIPPEDRFAVLSPQMYYNLIRDPSVSIAATSPTVTQATVGYPLLNDNLSPGNGNYAEARIMVCAGFNLVKSNHIPNTDITSGDAFFGTGAGAASANGNVYYGDFSLTAGIAFHRSAAGRVNLKALMVESARQIRMQGWLSVSSLAQGMGVLRPESAIELSTAV